MTLGNLKIGDVVRTANGNIHRTATPLFRVTSVSKTRAEAVAIPNMPDGTYNYNREGEVVKFTIPRGKVIGSYNTNVYDVEDPAEYIASNKEIIDANEARLQAAQNKWNKAVSMAHELNPVLNLTETPIKNAFYASFKVAENRDVAVILFIEYHEDALRGASEYAYSVTAAGAYSEYGHSGTFSSGGAHAATRDEAIYNWIASRY